MGKCTGSISRNSPRIDQQIDQFPLNSAVPGYPTRYYKAQCVVQLLLQTFSGLLPNSFNDQPGNGNDIRRQPFYPDRVIRNKPQQVRVAKITFPRNFKAMPDKPWIAFQQLCQRIRLARINSLHRLSEKRMCNFCVIH